MSTILGLVKSFLSLLIVLFKYVFYRAISSFLTGLVLLFVAVLMYVTFYQAYMPVVSHVKPVYLQFSSDCPGSSNALCSYPEASVFFTSANKAKDDRMLMRGQSYKVFLDLEMPPSPANEKLGMFMVNVKFLSAKGTVLKSSSRSCMLHYESGLVRLFKTVFYSLPLTLGMTEEKQKVEINFFDDYIDDSYNPAVQAKVVIMTKQVEIYSSTLRLQASFTGLRYIIFNWPVSFTFLAILGNFITVTLIYSAFINQFSSSPVPTSHNQEPSNGPQRTVFADRNGSRTNITLPLTEAKSNTANMGMLSSGRERASMSPRRNTTCKLCKDRNGQINRGSSSRSRFPTKTKKIHNPNTRKPRKIERQHLPDGLPKQATTKCHSSPSLHEHITEMSQMNKKRDDKVACSFKNASPVNLSGNQQAEHNIICSISGSSSHHDDGNHKQFASSKKHTTGEKELPRKTLTDHSKKVKTIGSSSVCPNVETDLSNSKSVTKFPVKAPSVWDSFCFARKWETFKLWRIRRLGKYLQENMPSFTKGVGHCMSDLELSSCEKNRLIQANCTRRSASASDLTAISTTFN